MSEEISFETWLASVLPNVPPPAIAAYNFNLAEAHDWVVEVIGASTYDKDDDEWACPPTAWNSCPPDFSIPRHIAPTWELALTYVCERVDSFLTDGKCPQAEILREAEAVCAGFVDGSLSLIWKSNKTRSCPPTWPTALGLERPRSTCATTAKVTSPDIFEFTDLGGRNA